MFDDARPHRGHQDLWVALPESETLTCARCRFITDQKNVAAYTRTRPGDPFDPWCHLCFYELVRWASQGVLAAHAFDNEHAAETIEELLSNGHN